MMVSMLRDGSSGDALKAYYLATDMTYKPIYFTPVNSNLTFTGSDVYGYTPNYWNGKECIVYRCNYASDMYTGLYDSHYYMIPFDLHFGNVSYFEFGVASVDNNGSMYNHYLSTGVQNFRDYNYIIAGDSISDVYELPTRVNGVNGAFVHCEQWDYPFCCFTYEDATASDFYLSDCYCFPCVSYGNDYLVISNIRINSGYVYYGHGDIPTPPVTTTMPPAGFGSLQGELVSGSDGYTVAITNDFPGYMYTGTYSDMSDNLGEAVTSIAEEVGAAAESAASAVGGLAAYDSGILWYMLERLFLNHPEVIAIISGLGAISLFGFVLNRYGR